MDHLISSCPRNTNFVAAIESQNKQLADEILTNYSNFPIYKQLCPSVDNESLAFQCLLTRQQQDLFLFNLSRNCDVIQTLASREHYLAHFLQTRLQPFIILVTTLTNILLVVTLTRPAMRTPTNLILLSISIADLLTGLFPFPVYIAFLTLYFDTNLTIAKAYVSYYLTVFLPTICHTISIWMTLLLAIQRFIHIKRPLSIRKYIICKFRGVQICICLVIMLSIFPNVTSILPKFQSVIILCMNKNTSKYVFESKLLKCTPIAEIAHLTLLGLRVCVINFGPSLILCVLTGYMSVSLHKIANNRIRLLNQNQEKIKIIQTVDNDRKSSQKLKIRKQTSNDAFKTSKIMLVVLGLFLLVELPTTLLIIIYAVMIAFQTVPPPYLSEAREICNLLLVFSYPFNFFIYFAMSKQFRQTVACFVPQSFRHLLAKNLVCENMQTTTISSENAC